MLIVTDNPLHGSINLDATTYFKVEGASLKFVGRGHFLEVDCHDEISAFIAYKRIISAYVAGERIIYLNELRCD